jgi:hypothetical protein
LATLSLLPAQCEEKLKLFGRYRACVWRKVNSSQLFGDTILSLAADEGRFGPSSLIGHGDDLCYARHTPLPLWIMVNKRLTTAWNVLVAR